MTAHRTHLKSRKNGRFDPDSIAKRLENLRSRANVEPKEIGLHLWPNQKAENAARSWYRRTSSRLQDFDLPEIEATVDYLLPKALDRGQVRGRHLPGFPFIDLWESEKLELGDAPKRR